MVTPSSFSQLDCQTQIQQWLEHEIHQPLSPQILKQLQDAVEIINPPPSKCFWRSQDIPGIWVVLSGKVRLLNQSNELLVSLTEGMSFGAASLERVDTLLDYEARASYQVTIGFIAQSRLRQCVELSDCLHPYLNQAAHRWNTFLQLRQNFPNSSGKELWAFSNELEWVDLEMGMIASDWQAQTELLFLLSGVITNQQGQTWQANQWLTRNALSQSIFQVKERLQGLRLRQQSSQQLLSKYASLDVLLDQIDVLNPPTRLEVSNCDRLSTSRPAPVIELAPQPFSNPQTHSKDTQINQAFFPSPTVRIGQFWRRMTRRYPVFLQQSASDCGAACLVMIGQYWNRRLSLNHLRDIANVDRNGASLRGLSHAAESIGFTTRPVRASLDQLARQPLPAIAHWEGSHYIVVYAITRNQVVIADPALGQKTLSHTDFQQGWTGYAMLLQPTAKFMDNQDQRQPLWQFFALLKPHRVIVAEVLLASIFIQLFGLVTPLLTQLLLDRVVVQQSELTLNTVGIGLLCFGLFQVAMTGLRQYLLDHTANRLDLALIVGFIRHTLSLPLSFFESRYVGDIISRIQENRKIQRFLTGESLSIVLDLFTVFIYVALMLRYSWKMALLTLVIIPPFVILALVTTPILQRASRAVFSAINAETGYLIQSLTGIRTVKAMAVEHSVRWEWEGLLGQLIRKGFSAQLIGNTLQVISNTIETLVSTALLWFGAWQVIHNQLTIGQLVAFNMLLGNVLNPFKRLIVLWNELQEVVIAVERINDVIDSAPEEDGLAYQALPELRGDIRFQQVTFRYHPESDTNTLENLSFQVEPGQMVALVGRSGSGKTTLSKLLLGLYPPTQGKILVDGYDITTLSLRSLRQQIGVVDQDTFLFGNTIRENIALGNPDASLQQIIEAATLAGAHSFIQALPMGYETQVGEGGGLLSGGQRQRIAIARALLGNPRLLIFDEATSHLDSESERIIQKNLSQILRDRTTIVIAHRLSTIRNADLILVLDRGILLESGTHEQLMQKKGQYYYLNQQQFAMA